MSGSLVLPLGESQSSDNGLLCLLLALSPFLLSYPLKLIALPAPACLRAFALFGAPLFTLMGHSFLSTLSLLHTHARMHAFGHSVSVFLAQG